MKMKYVVLKKDCKFVRMQTPQGTFEKDRIYSVADSFVPYSEMKVFNSKEKAQNYLAEPVTKKKLKKK